MLSRTRDGKDGCIRKSSSNTSSSTSIRSCNRREWFLDCTINTLHAKAVFFTSKCNTQPVHYHGTCRKLLQPEYLAVPSAALLQRLRLLPRGISDAAETNGACPDHTSLIWKWKSV
jgi:hypothetical protein